MSYDGERKQGEKRHWLKDERGREFIMDAQGVKQYRHQDDRNEAVDESYSLSPAVRDVFGLSSEDPDDQPRHIPALVAAHVLVLADMFLRESSGLLGATLREKLPVWEGRHFGRSLEPMAHAILLREVAARQVPPRAKSCGPFRNVADQLIYEGAAKEALAAHHGGQRRSDGETLQILREIVHHVTGKDPGPLAQPMPEAGSGE